MAMLRQFILRDEKVAAQMYAFIKVNARAMAEAGHPMQVTCAEYRTRRSVEQNNFMWKVVLEPFAEQAYVRGQHFVAETWNEHLKELFLPEVNSRGISKWLYLPSGERRLAMSTSDLNVAEMSEYLEKAMAYGASELGVQFPSSPDHQ